MCGIAGIVGRGSHDAIGAMASAIAHRGPDDEGFFISKDGEAALGNRRLSIIDLKGGHQPITTADGRYTITFNGEIYNFQEIRAELEKRGHSFRTRSDTEVLLHAYAEWGRGALERLRGMFAFAVWDALERRLFLARDRLGVKPLYYTQANGQLLFGSEIKSLLVHPGVPRRLNLCSLDDYLTYLYVPAPGTIFQGIDELEPGHWLEWQDGKVVTQRYWDVCFAQTPRSEQESCEELRAILDDAVCLRMISDVPVGVFLSGGIDSSSVTALMARHAGKEVCSFSLGFGEGEERYTEIHYAREVARRIGTNHCELTIVPHSTELLAATVRHFDEPFGNPTSLLLYQLSELSRKHVTVALVGDAGDEVFLGYPRYQGAVLSATLRRVPRFLRAILARSAEYLPESANGNHFNRRLKEFLSGSRYSPEEMYFYWISYFTREMRNRLYTDTLKQGLGDYDSAQFLQRLFRASGAEHFLDRISYVDLHSFLPFNLLRYSDRMSMAHSLEIRVPFTDQKLVEFSASLPWEMKLKGLRTKYILRRATEGLVPAMARTRPKLGLNPPIGLWLKNKLVPLLKEYLSPEKIRQRGYFRPDAVQSLIEEHQNGRRDYSPHLWALIVFEEWHRQYLD